MADMSRLLPGPWASTILQDLGAQVVKLEILPNADYARNIAQPLAKDKQSTIFHALNRGKLSIPIRKSDIKPILDVLEKADVLIESFKPGVLEQILEMDVAQIRQRFPRLVICRISGYGQHGPDSKTCILSPAHILY